MKRILLFWLIAVSIGFFVSCKNTSSPETKKEAPQPVKKISYTTFTENGLSGAKDLQGNILVPAKFDEISDKNGIIIAKKGDFSYFFDGNKQIFDIGADVYSVEDKFITCFDNKTGNNMFYFLKTGLTLPKIISCDSSEDVFMFEKPDHSYGFYTYDGETKAENLKNIMCLKKISKEGWTKQTSFLFHDDDAVNWYLYVEDGNLKYEMDLTTWQLLGLTYMTRDDSEDNIYKFTYTYRINIDEFMRDRKIHRTKQYYPPED